MSRPRSFRGGGSGRSARSGRPGSTLPTVDESSYSALSLAVAIVALLLSAGALIVAVLARSDSRRSAAASEAAAAEAQRENDRNDTLDRRDRNDRIRGALSAREEPHRDHTFRIHNAGTDRVSGLRVVDPPDLSGLPDVFELDPEGGKSERFEFRSPTKENNQLTVIWQGLDEPVKVPVRKRARMWVM